MIAIARFRRSPSRVFGDRHAAFPARRNAYLPDRVTGRRQIDVLVELEIKGHMIRIVIDAKFRAAPLDVKDVEEVIALSEAVGGDKAVIVASNGWYRPAAQRAMFSGLDLRLLTPDDARALIRSEVATTVTQESEALP